MTTFTPELTLRLLRSDRRGDVSLGGPDDVPDPEKPEGEFGQREIILIDSFLKTISGLEKGSVDDILAAIQADEVGRKWLGQNRATRIANAEDIYSLFARCLEDMRLLNYLGEDTRLIITYGSVRRYMTALNKYIGSFRTEKRSNFFKLLGK